MSVRLITAVAIAATFAFGIAEAKEGDAAAGEARYGETCRNCHGPAGMGLASYPQISGKDVAYITDRLERYRAGEVIGPNSFLMISMATDLSDDEIANLAAYLSSIDP